ncbi:MAG: type I 3-dehydroquinate dehydratase [Thermoplasmata archaeon]
MADPPKLVVSLPARSLAEAGPQIELARRAGADLGEIRFDRWSTEGRLRAAGLFPSGLPLIATLRSRAEGGDGPDDPGERAAFFATIADLPFTWIDLEAGRDDLLEIPSSVRPELGVIRSTHFAEGTTVAEVMRALDVPVPPRTLRKLVVPAPTGIAVRELVPAIQRAPVAPHRLILTTGGSGPLLRALGRRLGIPYVYAALPEGEAGGTLGQVEASQIPVDRLHRFFADPDQPPLFAVLGHPVLHSLSPSIHDHWMSATQRSGLYVPLDITTDAEFRFVLSRLAELGFRGLNVTHPWKTAALAYAARSSAAAKECGAANCLTWKGTDWEADNTDVLAMTRRLEELRAEGTWDGERMTVLGAGGAARATLVAARKLGARSTVYARRRSTAEKAALTYGSEVGDEASPVRTSLVIHATTAGAEPATPLSLPLGDVVERGGLVLDWVYRPAEPTVRERTRMAGARYESGERLLVYQAASSFSHWWGAPPSPESVRHVLAEVGCAA